MRGFHFILSRPPLTLCALVRPLRSHSFRFTSFHFHPSARSRLFFRRVLLSLLLRFIQPANLGASQPQF